MTKGIYCYIDKKNDKIVYIGRDSHLHSKQRDIAHKQSCNYNKQKINQIIQNNPNRYLYKILWEKDECTDNHLNQLEIYFIEKYAPKFNFTKGGGGTSGWKHTNDSLRKMKTPHSIETKKKIGNKNTKTYARVIKRGFNKFKQQKWGLVYKNFLCENLDKQFLQHLAFQINNNQMTLSEAKSQNQQYHIQKLSTSISKKQNKTGFFRVTRQDNRWKYRYHINNKRKCLSSTSLKTLEKRVRENNLKWQIVNKEKAKQSILLDGCDI